MGRVRNMLGYFITHPILFLYQVLQYVLDTLLSPTPPPPQASLARPKIAVIGAGLTGVSAASHIVGHGFDCRIFEAGPKEHLGGIWSRVNNTSGLQIHSSVYLFKIT
jgi:heterodisulfide reductase subunit A-like polyferredoxin